MLQWEFLHFQDLLVSLSLEVLRDEDDVNDGLLSGLGQIVLEINELRKLLTGHVNSNGNAIGLIESL
jgi:hypothetical protein